VLVAAARCGIGPASATRQRATVAGCLPRDARLCVVAVPGVMAAGSVAVAAVARAAPAAGVASGAVEEEPATARSIALADQVQLRGL
jgi:hypothetical protein